MGLVDVVLDLAVAYVWYFQDNKPELAIIMICFILLAGFISCVDTKPQFYLVPIYLLGIGFIVEYYKSLSNNLYETTSFLRVRVTESIFESFFTATLQLYVLFDEMDDDFLNIASIITSLMSLVYGITSVLKSDQTRLGNDLSIVIFLRGDQKIYLMYWFFLLCDFFLRTNKY